MYETTIPAEYIEITNIKPELTAEQNKSLCLSFLLLLSSACDHLAYYETYSDCMDYDTWKSARERRTEGLIQCRVLCRILPKLDYNVIDKDVIKEYIMYLPINGFCSFTDEYASFDSDDSDEEYPRLWQLLESSEHSNRDMKRLYKIIQKLFDNDILMLKTGVWYNY